MARCVRGAIGVFTGLLLVASATANSGSIISYDPSARMREGPSAHYDMCVGLWKSWVCWFTGMSWGSRHERIHEQVNREIQTEQLCSTVRCYAQHFVDMVFDVIAMILENPIQMWTNWAAYFGHFVHLQLPTLWYGLGFVLTFLVINFIAFVYLRVADVVVQLWKIGRMFLRLPIFTIVWRVSSSVWNLLTSLPKAKKGDTKKDAKEKEDDEKEANAVFVLNTPFMRELRSKIAMQRRTAEQQSSESSAAKGQCAYCGMYDHAEGNCPFRAVLRRKKRKTKREGDAEPKDGESKTQRVSSSDGKTSLYTHNCGLQG